MTVTPLDVRHTGTVIVGSGIAGLTAALTAGDCIVVSKTGLGDGSSRWAQGGIAAAVGAADDSNQHADDTLMVGRGLSDHGVATLVSGGAADRIEWLINLGAAFDRNPDGTIALGHEAGHSHARILHSEGDRTGAEVMRALTSATIERDDIERLDQTFAVDLIQDAGRVVGVLTRTASNELIAVVADAVVLATGGIGRLYSFTTNPSEATCDGLAMAARAGAAIRDPEFVQFHPTALAAATDPMPLITEALRGEGAVLLDAHGRRYMTDLHPDAELAPRDVVARENWQQLQSGPIYLDATVVGARFADRFPTVWAHASRAGLDPRTEVLPVSPAQHYHMGGIQSDAWGRTTLSGLFVCGEAASTGLNGANRLASNSLLEGLVFGTRVGEAINASPRFDAAATFAVPSSALNLEDWEDETAINELRRAMWNGAGIVRNEGCLTATKSILEARTPALSSGYVGRNLASVAHLVVDAALKRKESRGGHYRTDHPNHRGRRARHTVIRPIPEPQQKMALRRVQSFSS